MDRHRSAKLRKALGLHVEDVTKLTSATDWYSKYSHRSYFAEAALVGLSDPERRIVYGSFFDPAKDMPYRKEPRARTSACPFFISCCVLAAHALAKCEGAALS